MPPGPDLDVARWHTAAGWLFPRDHAAAWRRAVRRRLVGHGGLWADGRFRPQPFRPQGALAETVDALLLAAGEWARPLLVRYQDSVANLLPAWSGHPWLERALPLRSGLADFALRADWAGLRDFYWRRDVEEAVRADVVHLVVGLVRELGRPVALWLEDADVADESSLRTLELLRIYARGLPLLIGCTQSAAGAAGSPLETPGRSWPVASAPPAGEAAPAEPAGPARREDLYDEALRHLQGGDAERLRESSRRALDQAWGCSDLLVAAAWAEVFLDTGPEGVAPDLLRGLLSYDAGRFEDADRQLVRLLETGAAIPLDGLTACRLVAYNALFGLGQVARGRRLLEEVLCAYERQGRFRESGFLLNSIAFSLFREGRLDEAKECERRALEALDRAREPEGFLFSILQLNLGRLERTEGAAARALAHFERGMDQEFSPYMLLIFLVSKAQLEEREGRLAEAFDSFHQCLDLVRDLDLEHTAYPVYRLLAQPLAGRLQGRLTRGDEVLFYLHLHAAALAERLGLLGVSRATVEGLQKLWPHLDGPVWEAVEAFVRAPRGGPAAPGRVPAADADRAAEALRTFGPLVEPVAGAEDLAAVVAEGLASGLAVAVSGHRRLPGGIEVTDALVLCDPRRAEKIASLQRELGVSSGIFPPASGRAPRAASAALVLPDAEGWLSREPVACLQHETDVVPARRGAIPGLGPRRVRVQRVEPDTDDLLAAILSGFFRRSGVPLLAAIPFHLRRRAPAVTPARALTGFLASGLDLLVLDRRLWSKRLGAEAPQNLAHLRPRLLHNVTVNAATADDGLEVSIRASSHLRQLRLDPRVRPLLDLCDGRRSLEQVVHGSGVLATAEATGIYGFFRHLWTEGVISFEGPGDPVQEVQAATQGAGP